MVPTNLFGNKFMELRKKAGFTLRQFCLTYNLDPGNYSKLERGKIPPPVSRDKLEELASYLKLEEGTNEWYEFFDLAATCNRRIPDYLTDDVQLAEKLPLVFRTLRGEKVPEDKLYELAELIRKA